MTRKTLTVLVAVCFSAVLCFAGGEKGRMDPASHAAKLKAELNLTADQTAQVEKVFADTEKKMEPIHAKAEAAQAQLKALRNANPPDTAAIKAKEGELHAIHEQKGAVHAELDAGLKKILTPEQFAKYQELAAAHGRRHEHGEHPK